MIELYDIKSERLGTTIIDLYCSVDEDPENTWIRVFWDKYFYDQLTETEVDAIIRKIVTKIKELWERHDRRFKIFSNFITSIDENLRSKLVNYTNI
jgi:hypothetical protein